MFQKQRTAGLTLGAGFGGLAFNSAAAYPPNCCFPLADSDDDEEDMVVAVDAESDPVSFGAAVSMFSSTTTSTFLVLSLLLLVRAGKDAAERSGLGCCFLASSFL